jgi:hypothetical protein
VCGVDLDAGEPDVLQQSCGADEARQQLLDLRLLQGARRAERAEDVDRRDGRRCDGVRMDEAVRLPARVAQLRVERSSPRSDW